MFDAIHTLLVLRLPVAAGVSHDRTKHESARHISSTAEVSNNAGVILYVRTSNMKTIDNNDDARTSVDDDQPSR